MKIISLKAENIKRLTAVEITPSGNVVEITGKNGNGKTSVLDAIWWCLGGTEHVQAEPIRRGSDTAHVTLDLGDYVVTRKFKRVDGKPSTTSLTVANREGARFQSPQSMLDGFLSGLTFDPLEFARMKPREQFDALRQFVPGVDFDAIAKANKADYDARTVANRTNATAAAAASSVAVPDAVERINLAVIESDIASAGQKNATIDAETAARVDALRSADGYDRDAESLAYQMEEWKGEIVALQRRIAEAKGLREAKLENASTIRADITARQPVAEKVDITTLIISLRAARETNAVADAADAAAQRIKDLRRQASAAAAESDRLTAAMKDREAKKEAAIAAATLPVPGIGFADGAVTLNGLPFDQASDAEQLRTSIAVAMKMNPQLRVVRVRDGSLLDEDSMKIIAEMADDADCQVWIETVQSGRAGAIVIEDGHVAT